MNDFLPPRLLRVRQLFPPSLSLDIAATLKSQLGRLKVRTGQKIGIGVGSRGITHLFEIVRTIVEFLRAAGAVPFIIPAMGSHGGATLEGQIALLAEYNVSEASLGVPILASMDVRLVGSTEEGAEVFLSAEALDADGIVVVNRVKPHTDFAGELGSGLMKMLAIGLGKRVGATSLHASASRFGHEPVLLHAARIALKQLPVLGGVAVVENQHHDIALLEVLTAAEVENREKELLRIARGLMPLLPVDDIDLLIVDYLGKNISGAGMDPNVIGRGVQGYSSALSDMTTKPVIRRIFVRDLTPESRGNAIGVGMADFTSSRLVDAINKSATFINSITALTHQCAKTPPHFDHDADTIANAIATVALPTNRQPRIVQIRDTMNLETLNLSENFEAEIRSRTDLAILDSARPMHFDSLGRLNDVG